MIYQTDLRNRCYNLSLRLIDFIDHLPKETSTEVIGKQLLRSSMSIGANLTEATASGSRIEFKKFHEIALKSANESKYWLGLLRDTNKANKNLVNSILHELIEVSNMIAKGILRLKNKL